jgi:hypothetical protein
MGVSADDFVSVTKEWLAMVTVKKNLDAEKMLEEESRRRSAERETENRGAIHQLLNIIFQLTILVLLLVSTPPYVVKVKNYS